MLLERPYNCYVNTHYFKGRKVLIKELPQILSPLVVVFSNGQECLHFSFLFLENIFIRLVAVNRPSLNMILVDPFVDPKGCSNPEQILPVSHSSP